MAASHQTKRSTHDLDSNIGIYHYKFIVTLKQTNTAMLTTATAQDL